MQPPSKERLAMTTKPLDLAQFEGHTPGPWLVVPASQPSPHKDYNVVAADMRGVGANWRTKEGLPDALLHAAAPALLAECRRLQAENARLREALAACRADLQSVGYDSDEARAALGAA